MTTTPARGLGLGLPPPTVRPALAPFARGPVLAVAAAVAVLLGVVSARYGWFGDEYYFLSAGARPSTGYADQPPLLPLLAALLDHLAPGNLVVLRLPATVLTAVGTVVAALLAREFGGGRRAQVLATAVTAISPYLLATGHLLATSTVDPVCWATALWLLARWLRQERDGAADDRLLLGLGLVVAVALFDKVLIVVLLGALVVGVAVSGPRRLFGRPSLWAGTGLAAASTVPTLVWQARHGWPQLHMGSVVAGESSLFGDRWQFLPRALYYAGLAPGAVLVLLGAWALLRHPPLAPWRSFGWASLTVTAVLLAAGGRPYYLSGLYAVLIAAGAVAFCALPRSRRRVWWRWAVHPAAVVVSAVLTVLWVLPFGPASWRAPTEFETMGQVGWPEFAAGVARQWHALPPGTVVVAYSYWYAAALEHEGPRFGLPTPVYSTHRGFGYFDVPPGSADALLVGDVKWAPRFCRRLVLLPMYVGPRVTPVNDRVLLAVCTPSRSWAEAWPELRNLA
ncbi:glycosyltransferase family 39 protein [Actinomycetospora sp. NBRC 106378]|uniref:glycosyltransferase family 39 protein n=1 Tax=Actinomycetospora sp. NBRC 106378 TaxID=3032208 RepID=UPI00249FA261|nr:glycosyltransferase family 39 protein [Actinomycetospora sp. NBRC 106378]GLZ54895.1 glycosyl transferase family 39 [Actinomycetospora sp. NBRC 106378]